MKSDRIWRTRQATRGRIATVRAVVVRLTLDLGREPTDLEVAKLLATSVRHVARARRVVRP